MNIVASFFLLGSFLIVLNACGANPRVEIPLRVTMMVIDPLCSDVSESIPIKLKSRGISSEWVDKNQGALSVGPIIEKSKLNGVYSMIRHEYELRITCGGELSTSITGNATLEGLNVDNKWVPITDVQTVEKIALEFLRTLDL
jgi:hypothetical protein